MENKDLTKLFIESFSAGMAAGIMRFAQARHINFRPGTKSAQPLIDFAALLSSEEIQGAPVFPFPESFKQGVGVLFSESSGVIAALADNGETETAKAMCRVLGLGETLDFLERHAAQSITIIKSIRGDDIVENKMDN